VEEGQKPWWQQATALVTVSASGVITGLNFVPGTAQTATSPAAVPLHLLALDRAPKAAAPGATAAGDAQVRAAVVNVAKYYLKLARANGPAQMEAIIWGKVSTDGADHGPSCAAFASLTLELAAQATGRQSWATGGTSYPWPIAKWADPRVDTNPASPAVISMQADAAAHGRWHPVGDGYTPQPGDWALYDGHVEVVVSYAHGVLDTIGADSLPDLTVNEHSSSGPFASQGIAGFVDNGNLPLAAGTQPAAAAPASPAAAASPAAPAVTVRPGARHSPGAAAAGKDAEVPGLPGAAAFTSAGGIPGAGGTPVRTVSAGRTASVPGLLPAAGSPGTTLSRGAALIPGASPSPQTRAAGPAAPRATVPHATTPATPAAPGTAAPRTAPPSRGGTSQGNGPATPAQRAFIAGLVPGAVAAHQKYGVPASVTIAQAIDESGWGQSSLAAQNHNLFGIKGTGPAGSVTLPSQEFEGGAWVTIDAQFAAYHNDAESIAGHAQLLAASGYYTKAMADRANPDTFASDLTGVYATDPGYGANLIALMKLYNLYQYDTAPVTAAAATAGTAPATAGSGAAAVPGVTAPAQAGTGEAGIPGLAPAGPARVVTTAYVIPARSVPPCPAMVNVAPAPAGAALAGLAVAGGAGLAAAGRRRRAVRYAEPLPQATATALFASAKGPLSRGENLYRDVAAGTGVSWELLAAADWMQCEADPRRSPVHGEKLGARNGDGTCYPVRSAALARCAADLLSLAAAVYNLDLTAPRLSVRDLAAAFAAFRWGALLKRHEVSAIEFPYSVAGLTSGHLKMRWPAIDDPGAPDKPGSRFHGPFGAVPVVLSLGYPATTG
jgi:flagellum-specific peptidoglycan hydrolase FlgJ